MTDAIDDYVSTVGAELRGSARLRADMLAEIRDALVDASESHQAAGLAGQEAEEQAVREFGSARRIAAGLQEVLAVAHGRRTALVFLAVVGVQALGAELLGHLGGWRMMWGDEQPGAAYLWLARTTDLLAGGALVAAVAAVLLLGRGLRHVGIRLGLVRLTAALAATMIVLTVGCGVLLTVLPSSAGAAVTVTGVTGAVLSAVPVLVCARRSWLAAVGPGRALIYSGQRGKPDPDWISARRARQR
ncbi:permease prefix domain 1-containing protein [Plantactinospora sp. B24E8]|uniref:permease prefix domain 1-containing protein n=1 Tax=Plantactinospora sp. B24E8 TaxID=3153567 RepID=UPI00325EF6B1